MHLPSMSTGTSLSIKVVKFMGEIFSRIFSFIGLYKKSKFPAAAISFPRSFFEFYEKCVKIYSEHISAAFQV